jgi:hypothetical protein
VYDKPGTSWRESLAIPEELSEGVYAATLDRLVLGLLDHFF